MSAQETSNGRDPGATDPPSDPGHVERPPGAGAGERAVVGKTPDGTRGRGASASPGRGGPSVDMRPPGWLRRRAVVLDVETKRHGRAHAGREGVVRGVSRHPQTGSFAFFTVELDGGPVVSLGTGEVRLLD